MGKRRDRRHAALGAGGRRMKLDLTNDDEVANQEENMSISATAEEGGEKTGVESDERLSPHSLPGPVQVNPLSLLGQYSDEDEEQEKVLANGSSGGAVAVTGRLDEQVADFLTDLETSGLLKDDEVVSDENGIEAEGAKHAKSPQDVETKGKEVICEWDAVLHKESSEYYYWNKVTGETTWEKPAAYAASEVLKKSEVHVGLEEDSKPIFEDPQFRSKPAHVTLVQEPVFTKYIEAKDDISSSERLLVGSVEGDELKDGGSEENQDADRNLEDGEETDILLETKESFERITSPSGVAVKSCPGIEGDSEVTAAVIEHGAREPRHVEESPTLNIVENGDGAEDLTVGSVSSEGVKDHSTTVDRADATGLDSVERTKRYDHHRLLERGEVLAQKSKILAGEALRCLSLKLRLAVESEVRLADCKAMSLHGIVEDRFWEHMDTQMTRLEDLLLVEQSASSLEAEHQPLTTIVEDAKPESRAEEYIHGAQGTQHQPAVVLEEIFKSAAQLDEDMDVDMDVDMGTEDQSNVETSAVSRSAVHGVPSSLPASLVDESTVPQPAVYMPPPLVPQVVSYGHIEALPPDAYIPSAQSLPPLSEARLFPVAPLFPSVASPFTSIQSSVPLPQADSWVPPPPPEEEWAPPPLPDQEAPPPPSPDEDEPPLPSASDISALGPPYPSSTASVLPSRVYRPIGTNQTSQENTGSERHDTDSTCFGLVDADTGLIHVNGNALPPSVVSTGAAETTTKKSSSKVRNKKRSHSTAVGASLMSKKKVSSLVNKWLAAQEELHSSDEEEEDKDLFDVEALEKKRQKEIEEWRHQTLASGGALENANFQPLGTLDWRERVKRAKREASKLAAKQEKDSKAEESKKDTAHPSDESTPNVDKVAASTTPPKRPDLKELSRDLPPGWQAFWDTESCEVYYGNLTTSETSWDRPI